MSTLIVGCGYLGRRVGEILAKRHENVFGTTRHVERKPELAALGITPLIADVLDPTSLVSLPKVDRVLYCVGFDRSARIPFSTVYLGGLGHALTALKGRTKRIVYASSTGVYGRNDGGWVDEETPPEPTTQSGKVVLEAEGLVAASSVRFGSDFSVIRFSGLYGPGRIIRRTALEKGEPIAGDPLRFLNLIHILDAAIATIAVLDWGASGRIYHASDDNPVERQRWYEETALLLGAPPPKFVAPEPGTGSLAREESNKRISNRRIKEELGLRLNYPHFSEGLFAALEEERFRASKG